MSKIKNDWLDQYGAELFEQHQFGTAGIEVVKFTVSGNMWYIFGRALSVSAGI